MSRARAFRPRSRLCRDGICSRARQCLADEPTNGATRRHPSPWVLRGRRRRHPSLCCLPDAAPAHGRAAHASATVALPRPPHRTWHCRGSGYWCRDVRLLAVHPTQGRHQRSAQRQFARRRPPIGLLLRCNSIVGHSRPSAPPSLMRRRHSPPPSKGRRLWGIGLLWSGLPSAASTGGGGVWSQIGDLRAKGCRRQEGHQRGVCQDGAALDEPF